MQKKNAETLTREDVLHMAKLASLSIDEKEIVSFQKKLADTLSYVENINEIKEAQSVPPTNQVTSLRDVFFEDGTKNTRGLSQKEATANARNVRNGRFVVIRLI